MSSDPDRVREVREARRRYHNARSRALYWSGAPTFTGHRYLPGHVRGKATADEQYEVAICDCRAWEAEIGRLTGRRLKPYDPKALVRERWCKVNRSLRREEHGD